MIVLLYGMREVFGQITFAVAILILALCKVCIAVVANMLTVHAFVLTRHIHPALIAPEVSVLVYTIANLLVACVAVMVVYLIMSTVDDSIATIAVVVLVIVYVIAYEFFVTFIAVSVVIIVAAPYGNPYATPVTGVIVAIILMVSVIRIFFTLGFLATDVAKNVPVIVDMVVAFKLISTFVAIPITVGVDTNIGHPAAALITVMITVFIYVILAKLLHTVSRAVAILTSSVIIPVVAIVAQPKIAIIAEVIEVTVFVQKIIFLIAPVEIFQTSIAESVFVFIHVLDARNQVSAHVTDFVTVFVYAGNATPAYVAIAVLIFIRTHIVESSAADPTFM